jgi:signal transduction histidine kinase
VEKAIDTECLAAIDRIVTGLAHESRNALQRCQACLSVLSTKLAGRPDLTDLLDRMQAAQDDLHRLFNQLREYAAPINLDLGMCDLAEVCRHAWSDIEPLWRGREVEFREESVLADSWCVADPSYMKRVFSNLLENALGAVTGSARVLVRFARAELNGQDAMRINIRDNGPGLAGVDKQKIFEPFVTTKVRGTGLGLAICKRIVEAHGGTIAAGNGPEPGAEILVTFPRGKA